MCKLTELQHNIHSITKDGYDIAAFLADTMRGETPGVKVCHRMEAAKHLIRYGFTDTQCETTSDRLSRAGGIPERQGDDETPVQSPLSPGERARVRGEEIAAPVTHLDIINYEIAHLIRHETADGHTVVNFLVDIMTGRDRPFTPKKFCIKPADRMAAARELLRRGFGDLGSRRRLSDTSDEANAYDTLHTDLAKRMREYSERGADTIRFLLEVMSDPNPEEEFTIHHRMSAAQELLRRGWDTNYDNIKPEHLQDYWRDKESTRLSIGQKKTQAGLSTSVDDYDNFDDTDYEAIAKEMREEEDRQAAANEPKRRTITPSPSTGEGWDGGEISLPSSPSISDKAPFAATSNPPLPQEEGRGEGSDNSLPPRRGKVRMGVTEPVSKDMPLSTLENEPTANQKAIIKEFREAMDKGDERAALRAEAKYRRIDVKPEKNIYDYGPNDPDPTIDYYFEPLSKEEQAKFDQKDRREHGLTEEEIADFTSVPASKGKSDPLKQLAQAAATHNTPILPNPLAPKRKNPTIRSP